MATTYKIEITGDQKLMNALKGMEDKLPHAVAMAIYEEASKIFIESQLLVPIDTGALRGSGFVTLPEITSISSKVAIQYGGAAAPYALIVHERINAMSGNPIFHRPPTQAKYLSIPVERAIPTFGTRILGRVRHILEGR